MQTKCDALFQEKSDSKQYLGYSLKTQKSWSYRSERGYRKDLQGVIEKLGIEYSFQGQREAIEEAIANLELIELKENPKIIQYLQKNLPPEKIMGIKFCFLIKGDRKEEKNELVSNGNKGVRILSENELLNSKQNEVAKKLVESNIFANQQRSSDSYWYTSNPLIYGYKKITPSEILYAHSDKTIKPENKSGFGKLGKGWESFNVWECEEVGLVKGWIDLIMEGKVQGDLPNPVRESVISPIEFYRSEKEIDKRWITN